MGDDFFFSNLESTFLSFASNIAVFSSWFLLIFEYVVAEPICYLNIPSCFSIRCQDHAHDHHDHHRHHGYHHGYHYRHHDNHDHDQVVYFSILCVIFIRPTFFDIFCIKFDHDHHASSWYFLNISFISSAHQFGSVYQFIRLAHQFSSFHISSIYHFISLSVLHSSIHILIHHFTLTSVYWVIELRMSMIIRIEDRPPNSSPWRIKFLVFIYFFTLFCW